ncbi:hypothetical protein [Chryseobacterium culicis]|uniref:hypothetical protein n=1 Tax=Chryseobacterium culicis TaxID=680127 RepID=UPI001873F9DD|nr:hypothetical protein [Chryseobacterium culicis]MBE4949929.1 hypothetical protein [Chryseobacterium culicis]
MKTTFKNYYLIQHPKGEILPHTMSFERRSCISNFLEGSSMTWNETRKLGWKCLKVNVNFEIL